MDDYIYLESKLKYKGVVYKRRIRLTKEEYNLYITKRKLPNHDTQIIKEIDYFINYYKLHPYMFLSYDRYSYVSKEDNEFRLTFDYNLKSRLNNLSLNRNKKDELYFKDNTYIMEIKCLDSLPLWFTHELNKLKIYPNSFSKIGKIYERGIIC